MNILIFNIIFSIVESILFFSAKKKRAIDRFIYCILIFIQCFILHAFLNPFTMEDLPGYIETFELFSKNSLEHSIFIGYAGVKMEIGWTILCKLLSLISNNYRILLIFTSLIMVGSYVYSIKKYSPIIWLAVLIYLCTVYDQSLFVLRQHTAMAICLLSIPSIAKRDLKVFLLFYILAISIHMTAIVFGVVYPLAGMKLNRRFWIILLLITIILTITSSVFFNWFFANTWYNSYEDKEGSNYTGFLIALSTLLLYLYSINWNTNSIQIVEKCFLSLAIIAVVISFIGAGFSPTNRLIKYFTISSIFLIPISISNLKHPSNKCLITCIVVCLYTILFFSRSNLHYIENYQLFL